MAGQRGFTLLELLVVLTIAGLMTGLGVAWLDSGASRAEQALVRLASLTREQAALARHAGQLRGLRWNGQRPEFVRHDGRDWVVQAVGLGDWPATLRPDWPGSAAVQLVFTPDGWASCGQVLWRWPQGRQRWQWNRGGQLRLEPMP
ncbi:type II secretion system minor pseudopilin GspH [Pseudomonas fulva]|nr:type II secretion system minor pseudopilin GspH [Pseudomonas fulva]MBF8779869.1 type II secretion system minor pseudopilin GspH [Pseudomonas fulva]